MRSILFLTLVFAVHIPFAAGELKSPIPSSVPGISIPNTHFIARDKGFVLRGMAPLRNAEVDQLAAAGITEILIFRNSDSHTNDAILIEKELLDKNGKIPTVHTIPFRWRDINDFKVACEHTIQALQIIKTTLATPGAGLFFHCTVGEDRTGYLAGLYRILFEQEDVIDVFDNEMCLRGYAEGDPVKPKHVVDQVHKNLTPLFLKMLMLIREGKLNKHTLDTSICSDEPTGADNPTLAIFNKCRFTWKQ